MSLYQQNITWVCITWHIWKLPLQLSDSSNPAPDAQACMAEIPLPGEELLILLVPQPLNTKLLPNQDPFLTFDMDSQLVYRIRPLSPCSFGGQEHYFTVPCAISQDKHWQTFSYLQHCLSACILLSLDTSKLRFKLFSGLEGTSRDRCIGFCLYSVGIKHSLKLLGFVLCGWSCLSHLPHKYIVSLHGNFISVYVLTCVRTDGLIENTNTLVHCIVYVKVPVLRFSWNKWLGSVLESGIRLLPLVKF